jgi:hypothetical protein
MNGALVKSRHHLMFTVLPFHPPIQNVALLAKCGFGKPSYRERVAKEMRTDLLEHEIKTARDVWMYYHPESPEGTTLALAIPVEEFIKSDRAMPATGSRFPKSFAEQLQDFLYHCGLAHAQPVVVLEPERWLDGMPEDRHVLIPLIPGAPLEGDIPHFKNMEGWMGLLPNGLEAKQGFAQYLRVLLPNYGIAAKGSFDLRDATVKRKHMEKFMLSKPEERDLRYNSTIVDAAFVLSKCLEMGFDSQEMFDGVFPAN